MEKWIFVLEKDEQLANDLGQIITSDFADWQVRVFPERHQLTQALNYLNGSQPERIPEWIFTADPRLVMMLQDRDDLVRKPRIVVLHENSAEEAGRDKHARMGYEAVCKPICPKVLQPLLEPKG